MKVVAHMLALPTASILMFVQTLHKAYGDMVHKLLCVFFSI